eukprot:13879449-Heterocapsa_arctica.AAC.1
MGLTSYSKFGCDYNPQMANASLLATQLLKPLGGRSASSHVGRTSSHRRRPVFLPQALHRPVTT